MAAAAKAAAVCGVEVRLLGGALEGEARDLGRRQAQLTLDIHSAMHPNAQPVLLLLGGECTVTRGGNGIGGPNAEFTLSAAIALNGQIGVHVRPELTQDLKRSHLRVNAVAIRLMLSKRTMLTAFLNR